MDDDGYGAMRECLNIGLITPGRNERLRRIEPMLRALHAWMESPSISPNGVPDNLFDKSVPGPNIKKEDMIEFMRDMKEEGNAMFKEKIYKQASEFYTQSLVAAKVLQSHHAMDADPEFVSSLFSNRATCYFKMEMYKKSIEDADYAIYLNYNNIKAYFRKAAAHKAQGDYLDALSTAEKALQKARQMGKNPEVREIDELIKDIKRKLPAQAQAGNFTPGFSSKKNESTANGGVKPKVKEHPAEVSAFGATKGRKKAEVDESWLKGTAAAVPTKPRETAPKTKKQKKKELKQQKLQGGKIISNEPKKAPDVSSQAQRSSYQGRFAVMNKDESSESEETESSDSSADDQPQESWASQVVDDDLSYELDYSLGAEEYQFTGTRSHKSKDTRQNGRPAKSAFGTKSKDTPWQQVGTASKAVPPQEKSRLSDFPFFMPPVNPPYPLDNTYYFTLVCERCYAKVGEGPTGYKPQPNLVHNCEHNVMLIKYQKETDKPWIKIRPRQNVTYLGKFQICKTYPNGQSCKVGESKCSFAHFREEIHFWTLDREGHINIEGFIKKQQEILRNGQMKKVLKGKIIEDRTALPIPDMTKPPPSHKVSQKQTTSQQQAPPLMQGYNSQSYLRKTPPQQLQQAGPVARQAAYGQYAYGHQTQHPQQTKAAEEIDKQRFPLQDTHRFRIVCFDCLKPMHSQYDVFHHIQLGPHHACTQDQLIVQTKRDPEGGWVRVRERKNHREFPGKYALCRYQMEGVEHGDEERCSFAHNRIEQFLWGLEKDNIFSIQEFVLQNRAGGNQAKLFSVVELLRRHPGDFVMLCRSCFYNAPKILSTQDPRTPVQCNNPKTRHNWADNKYLVFFIQLEDNRIDIHTIEKRPFQHKTAFFNLCKYTHMCLKKAQRTCVFAHSPVERDVWLVERDTELTQDEIVFEFNKMKEQAVLAQHPQVSSSPANSGRSTPANSSSQTAATTTTNKTTSNQPAAKAAAAAVDKNRPPYFMTEICQICWRSGQRSIQDKKKEDRCAGRAMGHPWSIHKMCVVLTKTKQMKEIRKMPAGSNMTRGISFILCVQIQQKKKCQYGDRCTFAHSIEEMEIWNYMIKNKIKTYEEMVEVCRKYQEEDQKGKTIEKGQSVVSAKPVPPGAYKPAKQPPGLSQLMLAQIMYHCQYCSVTCNSQKQWDEHCASTNHMFNVNSDKEHQWNYRQPPWGVGGGKYTLCDNHLNGSKCRYSNVPEIHNLCQSAHSQAELDEWRERWEWRQMKRDIARKEKVFSYMEELLEEFEQAESPIAVLADEAEGAVVICSEENNVFMDNKNAVFSWLFEIQSQRSLDKVALLLNKDRLHFNIKVPEEQKGAQIAQGAMFDQTEHGPTKLYKVQVDFKGGLFGSFMQWVVFDFGGKPVVVRKLSVELGTQHVQEQVRTLRDRLTFDRWTDENREIIRFDLARPAESSLDVSVLKQYRAPSTADAVVTQETVGVELNRHNYVHKMHKLLQLEELTRTQCIAGYNLKTEIELTKMIRDGAFIHAREGELFAKVPLNEELSEDTDAGKLILTSVQQVLLAPQHTESKTVYEAVILQKENFDYNGKGKDYIYLCLSPECVRILKLDSGDSLPIEIQFQMDRRPFCQMHYAVDQLTNNDLVFPDISKINPSFNEIETLRVSSDMLNEEQLQIVRHVVAQRQGYTPPLIIYGPFGTGKTETIAQASMLLLSNRQDARILICTHSNSAADLYITKHLDAFVEKYVYRGYKLKLLRIYFQERRKSTVSPTVLKYCIFKAEGSSFRNPCPQDLHGCSIVITTLSTSLTLTRLNAKGYFTHIFIDEAAQALECETIMPLSLADMSTCVVLAGDHMQMGPKAYSAEAKRQLFDKSLLERLYHHYEMYQSLLDKSKPLKLPLKLNYRSKMEILRFISAISYGGPSELGAKSEQQDVVGIVPLTFYVAQGKEVQEADSTSYYNLAEVEEVVARVVELYDSWPEQEWGERRGESIAVVTPYFDQVNRIRQALRKRRHDLRSVIVERVMNMQGKEFRAVFISTVRTTHLAEKDIRHVRDRVTECDGDVGDFGFLSDQKLLNTAMTRAQSFVGVVGDPVALCALGECENVWRAYLKHCSQLASIFPIEVSFNSIKTKVLEFTNSPLASKIASINAMNKEHAGDYPGRISASASSSATSQTSQNAPQFEYASILKGDERKVAPPVAAAHRAVASGDMSRKDAGQLSVAELRSQWVTAAEMLKQLAFDAVTKQQLAAGKSDRGISKVTRVDQIDFRWLEIKEEEGHAIISYDEAPVSTDPYDSDDLDTSFGDDINDLLMNKTSNAMEQSPSQLRNLLKSNPFKYKQCLLRIKSEHRMVAKVLDPSSQVNTVLIATRERCGRAMDGDEVVVEILHEKRLEKSQAEYTPQAQVLGVLKRRVNVTERLFVCTVNPQNTGELIPINQSLPHIYNLETPARAQRARKGLVTVYAINKDGDISFHHHEPLPTLSNKLFVVRCLRWDAKFHSPVGVVLDIIPIGNSEDNGMLLLSTEYNLPPSVFSPELMRQLSQELPEGFQIPEQNFTKRMDFRKNAAFTIADEQTSCRNFALSFDMVKAGQFLLGVHVVDISHFVKKGKLLDTEAGERGIEFFEANNYCVPIYPERLKKQIFELSPGQDRLTLSLFFQIDSQANILRMTPKKCVVNSKKHLSLEEVQTMIKKPSDGGDGIHISVLGLHKVASTWRSKRLGSDARIPDPDMAADDFDARVLVHEIELLTNQYVAENLLGTYEQTTPLLRQRPPAQHLLEKWRQSFGEHAWNTMGLSRHFRNPGETCTCSDVCNCITLPVDAKSLMPVLIEANSWSSVRNSLVNQSTSGINVMVADTESRPQVVLAWRHLESICTPAQFAAAGEMAEDLAERRHYGNNINSLTGFTRPLTSYLDSVVHRLLIAVLKNQPCPYSQHDIIALCSRTNDAISRAREYSRSTRALQLALNLSTQPLSFYPLIEAVDAASLTFKLPSSLHSILSTMQLSMDAVLYPGAAMAQRAAGDLTVQLPVKVTSANGDEPTDGWWPKYIEIPSLHWQALLISVKKKDTRAILDAAITANEAVSEHASSSVTLTPEGVTMTLTPGHVARIQLASDVQQGLLQPCIQLFSPAPSFDICVEHRSDPLKCFLNILPTEELNRAQYPDMETYESTWQQGLAIEACEAIRDTVAPTVISGVDAMWYKLEGDLDNYMALIDLPLDFCVQNGFTFVLDQYALHTLSMFPNYSSFQMVTEEERAYVCLRHPNIPTQPTVASDLSRRGTFTWVAHCTLCKVTVQNGVARLELHLIHSAVQPPDNLIEKPIAATIEVIEKPEEIRVYQKALLALQKASQLCKDIVLGWQPKPLDTAYTGLMEHLPPIPSNQVPLDQMQSQALHRALTQPFTLIQGVAGAGKTTLAARLAYIFVQINSRVNAATKHVDEFALKQVVMVCAPTQAALDVFENKTKSYGSLGILHLRDMVAPLDGAKSSAYDMIMCTTAQALHVRKFTDKFFNVVQIIVDNSQMCTEPNLVVPLAYFSPYQVILLGDEAQLPPHVVSERARRLGFATSMFHRYSHKATRLTQHYRMHQGLAEFPANNIYSTVMASMRNEQTKPSMMKLWPQDRDRPVVFMDLGDAIAEYADLWAGREASKFNQEEINEACRMVTSLVRRHHANPSEVAVLSTNPNQCNKIREALNLKGEQHVNVSTVYDSAGKEWDYVIISCVSSLLSQHIEARPSDAWLKRHLGSIAEKYNVATIITRAKKGLIIIGNRRLLQLNDTWKRLLELYDLQGKIVDARTFGK